MFKKKKEKKNIGYSLLYNAYAIAASATATKPMIMRLQASLDN
jgi:hypothetical protein